MAELPNDPQTTPASKQRARAATLAKRAAQATVTALLCGLAAHPLAAGTTLCIDTDSENWQWMHPTTHGQEMRVVQWIPERAEFVAMGDAVVTTPDGATGTPGHRFAPWMVVDFVWNASAGVSGEFIAVAEDVTRFGGAILRSTDLASWTTVEVLDWLPSGIAWNGTRYVVVGDYDGAAPAGNALTSTDGLTWARTDTNSTVYLGDLIFANGRFVAVGQGGTVRTSSDGLTWSSPSTPPANETLTTVRWTGSLLVATGPFADDLFTSTDGDTWASTPLPTDARALAVMGSTVYLVDHQGLTHSRVYSSPDTDLTDWSITGALGRVTDLASNGTDQVAVGLSGTQSRGADGWNWQFSDDAFATEDFKHLVALDGVTLASTEAGTIIRSTDHGATWTQTNSASNRIGYLTDNGDPANPLFLTQLVNGSPSLTTSYETSSDGVTWTSVTGPLGGQWFVFQGAGGRFFASKNFDLYSSTDGNTWSLFYDGAFDDRYTYVERHAGLWIVLGDDGRMKTSPDGTTWTERTSQSTGILNGLSATHDGYLYLGSVNGEIVRSMDGLAWELVHKADTLIEAMAADDDGILALAFGPYDATSRDGNTWTLAGTAPAGNDLLTHDGTGWTNAGIFGVAFSVPGLEWTAQFQKTIHNNLSAIASIGDTVAIAGYDDLLTWVGSGVASGDPWQRTDLGSVAGMSTIATDGTRFVAAGYRNGSSANFTPNALFTSEDGLEWTERAPRPTYFENVVHGDFGFVVANQRGEILQSDDGVAWTLRGEFPTIYFTTVGWTGERYVAIGTDGEVVTSLDGVFFQQEPQTIPLYGTPWQGSTMAHRRDGAQALTVLVGDIGRTWVSTDHGRTWTVGRAGSFGSTGMSNVKLIGSEFVATTKGAIAISTNGVDWTDFPTLSGLWVADLAPVHITGEDPAVWLVGNDGLVQKAPLDRDCDALAPPIDALIFSDGFESGDVLAWQ